jgi:hypothetical protein
MQFYLMLIFVIFLAKCNGRGNVMNLSSKLQGKHGMSASNLATSNAISPLKSDCWMLPVDYIGADGNEGFREKTQPL